MPAPTPSPSRPPDRTGWTGGLLLAGVVLAGSLPYGSPHPWAQMALTLLLLGWCAFAFIASHTTPFPWRGVRLPLCAFALLVGWSLFQTGIPAGAEGPYGSPAPLSVNTGAAHRALLLRTAAALLVIAVAWFAAPGRRLRALALCLAGSGTVQALAAMPGLIAAGRDGAALDRATGLFKSGAYFGAMLSLGALLTLGLLLQELRGIRRDFGGLLPLARQPAGPATGRLVWWAALALALLLQCTGLLLSASRGAILAFAPAALLLGFTWRLRGPAPRIRRPGWTAAGLALLLALLLGGGLFGLTRERFAELGDPERSMSLVGRLAIWDASALVLAAHPLGVGPGGFPDLAPSVQPKLLPDRRLAHAHNDYLELLCETGWPGLLPLLLLGGWFLHAGHRIYRGDPNQAWVRRGAWAGLLAGLLHLLVDSNLMVRPAYLALFAACTGLVATGRGEAPASIRQHLFPQLIKGLAPVVCLALALPAARMLQCAWLVETGSRALGFPPDPYFMLPVEPRTPEQGLALLERAAERCPSDAAPHLALGQAHIAAFEYQVERKTADYLLRFHGLDPQRVRAQVAAAETEARDRAVETALQSLTSARFAARYHPDVRAWETRVVGGSSNLADSSWDLFDYVNTVRQTLDHAPRDIVVHIVVLEGIRDLLSARPEDPELQALARETVARALSLTNAHKDTVMALATAMGIAPDTLIAMPGLGLDGLHFLYLQARETRDAASCLALLDAMEARRDAPRGLFDWAKRGEVDLAEFIVRERARWHLYRGDGQAYRAMETERTALPARRVEARLSAGGAHPGTRRLQLAALEEAHQLPMAWLPELTMLEGGRTDPAARRQRLIRLLLSDLPPSRPADPAILDIFAADGCPGLLVRAAGGDSAGVPGLLAEALARCPAPFSYRHRLLGWSAHARLTAGDGAGAAEDLRRAIEACPDDPALLELAERHFAETDWGRRAAERLAGLQPALALGTTWLAGDCVLRGIRVEPIPGSAADGRDIAVTALFRCFGPVPPALRLQASLWRGEERLLQAQRPFRDAARVRFGFGNPQVGSVMPVRFTFPVSARAADRLRLTLRNGADPLASDEGLVHLEFGTWQDGLPPRAERSKPEETEGLLILF